MSQDVVYFRKASMDFRAECVFFGVSIECAVDIVKGQLTPYFLPFLVKHIGRIWFISALFPMVFFSNYVPS